MGCDGAPPSATPDPRTGSSSFESDAGAGSIPESSGVCRIVKESARAVRFDCRPEGATACSGADLDAFPEMFDALIERTGGYRDVRTITCAGYTTGFMVFLNR